MDMSKFREELRSKLEGQYNAARQGMGLGQEEFEEPEFEMEEDVNDVNAAAKKLQQIQTKINRMRKEEIKAQGELEKAKAESGVTANPEQDPQPYPNQNDQQNDQQGLQDDIDYLDEGDEDISAKQGKNLLKFATNDKIAAAIMNMDDMELANFIDTGLKQAGVQLIADNMETAGGGEPVNSEPNTAVPAPQNGGVVNGDGSGGQEGNMKLADL